MIIIFVIVARCTFFCCCCCSGRHSTRFDNNSNAIAAHKTATPHSMKQIREMLVKIAFISLPVAFAQLCSILLLSFPFTYTNKPVQYLFHSFFVCLFLRRIFVFFLCWFFE